jgi:hypothetical protein
MGTTPNPGLDAWYLRRLSVGPDRTEVSGSERRELFEHALLRWPAQPSVLLRLASVAHGLDDGLDERLAGAPDQLADCAGRDPWRLEPNEAQTVLLAAVVRAEQFDYESFVPDGDLPMALRDSLTDPDDLSTIAAMVRWETMMRLSASTPDALLRSWRTHVSSIARNASSWDISEYDNTLDIRTHLQEFSAVLSWVGQAQWREHIEPVDEAFRACTERHDAPLALKPRVTPGEWWRYRVPAGDPQPFRERARRSLDARRYVAGPMGYGRFGGLRTISHVFELAERPDGLRAMTEKELAHWTRFTGRQAGAEPGAPDEPGFWRDRHARAEDERRRRATGASGRDH